MRLVGDSVVLGLKMKVRPRRRSAAGDQSKLGSRADELSGDHGDAAVAHVVIVRVVRPAVAQDDEVPATGSSTIQTAIRLAVVGQHHGAVERGKHRHADVLLPERVDPDVDAAVAVVAVLGAVEVTETRGPVEIDGAVEKQVPSQDPAQRVERIALRAVVSGERGPGQADEKRARIQPHVGNVHHDENRATAWARSSRNRHGWRNSSHVVTIEGQPEAANAIAGLDLVDASACPGLPDSVRLNGK